MKTSQRTSDGEKRDWAVIVLILVLGLFGILFAGEWALRFAPLWELDANALSKIDPNSDFLTNKPVGFIEPIDPEILNNPLSLNNILTPGAQFTTATPLPNEINTSVSTQAVTQAGTLAAAPTSTATVPPTPTTSFPGIFPSATRTPGGSSPTRTALPTSTATNPAAPSADLQITKDDGVTTYSPGSTVLYTVIVLNNGASNVVGAVINDAIPAQIVTWSWTCAAQTGGAAGCDSSINSNAGFTDAVNLPAGASITYSVSANVSGTATGDLINTASISVPVGYTDPNPANNSATDTDTFVPPSADLQITKTDGATDYFANSSRAYTITVSNPVGPSSVAGAMVTDMFPAQVSSVNWTCAGAGGATCTASGSGSINDTINLPVGSWVTYTVNVTIGAGASGDLTNTASVSLPAGFTDPVLGNNSSSDTDWFINSSPFPNGNIGTTKDGSITVLPPGSSATLTFGTPVVVGSHAGYDLVFYELPSGTGIMMDHVSIQVGDGYNWYTVFNWGDNNADTNSNLNINVIGGAEPDNRDFSTSPASDVLYTATGILIDLDGVAPNGTYLYIRILSPTGDTGDGADVDAIEVLP